MTKDEAVKWAGGQVKLAAALGMRSQGSIAGWGDWPPALRQLQIEALTRGKLRAEPNCDQYRVRPARKTEAKAGAA
jgi:hypothetical protein